MYRRALAAFLACVVSVCAFAGCGRHRIEGEIQQLPASFVVTELSEVLAGRAPGRSSAAEVTIFDSVGFALEDFSSLRYLMRIHQEERGSGRQIDLVPDIEDPKDLFGLLDPQPVERAARAGAAA